MPRRSRVPACAAAGGVIGRGRRADEKRRRLRQSPRRIRTLNYGAKELRLIFIAASQSRVPSLGPSVDEILPLVAAALVEVRGVVYPPAGADVAEAIEAGPVVAACSAPDRLE
jgi:hypothetical protein